MKLKNKIANAKVRAAAQMERPCPVVPQAPAPIAPPAPPAAPEAKKSAKKQAEYTEKKTKKYTMMMRPTVYALIELRAELHQMSMAEYMTQAALSDAMDERRAEDQRAASLDMIGLLRADLTRCLAVLQRRPDKDREMIDIMITLQRALDTINKREEDLSC